MMTKTLMVCGFGAILASSILAPGQKGPSKDSDAKSQTAPGHRVGDKGDKGDDGGHGTASGNSLLGLLEGAISFCGKISPGSPSIYRQVDVLLTSGASAQALAQARNSDDYGRAFKQTTDELRGLPASQALAECSSH